MTTKPPGFLYNHILIIGATVGIGWGEERLMLMKSSTTSNIAIVPAATLPAYSASKAALNTFMLYLREQLRETNQLGLLRYLRHRFNVCMSLSLPLLEFMMANGCSRIT